jgi:hypothetical protein
MQMEQRWEWLGLGVLGTLALGCASGEGPGRRARNGPAQEERFRGKSEHGQPDEEELKRGTGISQVGRVVAGGPVLPSTVSPGVDQERLWSESDDWEPIIAADRSSDHVYQMTTRLDARRSRVMFRASSDGGVTWGPDQLIWDAARQQYDPQLAVSGDGTVFACWLEVPRWETLVARSFDHGATWTAPVVVENNVAWTDHPWLTVSDDGQDVYVAFNMEDSFVVSSHDGGVTFERPVLTHESEHIWYHTGGAVAPDGTVYFAGAEYSQFYNGRIRVSVLRSTDRGASFQKTVLDRSEAAPPCEYSAGCYWGFLGPCTGLAIDSAGTVMVAYNAGRELGGPQQIYVRTSANGVAWRPAKQISFDNEAANNAFPVVVSGPAPGDFSVVWQGDRTGNTSAWNTWMRRTFDGGVTWEPEVQLSTRPDGAPYKTSKGYAFPYGDYMSAACDGRGRVHALWGAAESYNGPGGTWYTCTK